jgi:esterase/lipase superfamily enzyme
MHYMITNRLPSGDDLSDAPSLEPSYWVHESGDVELLSNWRRLSPRGFVLALATAAAKFPLVAGPAGHEAQRHVGLFVHGYNTTWRQSLARYRQVCRDLFAADSEDPLGVCVLFAWPSNGKAHHYLADRRDARASAQALAEALWLLHGWQQRMDAAALRDPEKGCRAKTSILAHSMGNYVVQHAMQGAWTRANQPLLVSLINQLVMIAADVDSDLFSTGESIGGGEGEGIMNLCYRVTALYSGRDAALGLSAGLKHFGKRRLGRRGLADPSRTPDNVWALDCSALLGDGDVHSGYFDSQPVREILRMILRGVDRRVIETGGGKVWGLECRA